MMGHMSYQNRVFSNILDIRRWLLMYTLLTILTGATLAVMISINGNLSARYGAFPAAAIIHAVGSVTAILLCLMQKEKKKITGHRPLWIYLGGFIGVATTVFHDLAAPLFGTNSIRRVAFSASAIRCSRAMLGFHEPFSIRLMSA